MNSNNHSFVFYSNISLYNIHIIFIFVCGVCEWWVCVVGVSGGGEWWVCVVGVSDVCVWWV